MRCHGVLMLVLVLLSLGAPPCVRSTAARPAPHRNSLLRRTFVPIALRYRQQVDRLLRLLGARRASLSAARAAVPSPVSLLRAALAPLPGDRRPCLCRRL